MHSAIPATAPISAPRYPTPLADAARKRTRQLMATHLRTAGVELTVCTTIFALLGFAAACAI
jgi:hypothetical protein